MFKHSTKLPTLTVSMATIRALCAVKFSSFSWIRRYKDSPWMKLQQTNMNSVVTNCLNSYTPIVTRKGRHILWEIDTQNVKHTATKLNLVTTAKCGGVRQAPMNRATFSWRVFFKIVTCTVREQTTTNWQYSMLLWCSLIVYRDDAEFQSKKLN